MTSATNSDRCPSRKLRPPYPTSTYEHCHLGHAVLLCPAIRCHWTSDSPSIPAQMGFSVWTGLSTGVSGDLKHARQRAVQMVRHFGIAGDIGQIALEELAGRDGSIPFAEQTARQVETIVSDQLKEAAGLIEANRSKFDHLVDALVEKNRLSENELSEILD